MATMTLADMIEKVAYAIHDPNHQRFTKKQIRNAIADEMTWYCKDLGILKKISKLIIFTKGVAIYKIASDCMEIIRMKMVGYSGQVIRPTTQEIIDINQSNGNAYGYDFENNYDESNQGTPSYFLKDTVEYGYIKLFPIPNLSGGATVDGDYGAASVITVGGEVVDTEGEYGIPRYLTDDSGTFIEADTGAMSTDGDVGAPVLFAADNGGALYDYYKTASVPAWATTADDANLTEVVVDTVPDFMLKDFELLAASSILRTSRKKEDKEEAAYYAMEFKREKQQTKRVKSSLASLHNNCTPM